MAGCSVEAQARPEQGRVGDRVTLTARVEPRGVAVAVRVAVAGYGFEEALVERGGVWAAETVVPYEASPGSYALDVYAVDASGQRCGSDRIEFTVLE